MGVVRRGVNCGVFFYKQKTAYEMLRSLVGSEMCIRDRASSRRSAQARTPGCGYPAGSARACRGCDPPCTPCLLYTSDAADDLLCVDLGGRRIIKKKKRIIGVSRCSRLHRMQRHASQYARRYTPTTHFRLICLTQ